MSWKMRGCWVLMLRPRGRAGPWAGRRRKARPATASCRARGGRSRTRPRRSRGPAGPPRARWRGGRAAGGGAFDRLLARERLAAVAPLPRQLLDLALLDRAEEDAVDRDHRGD